MHLSCRSLRWLEKYVHVNPNLLSLAQTLQHADGGNYPHVMRHVNPAMRRRYTGGSTGDYPLPSGSGSLSGVNPSGSFPTAIGTAYDASATASMGFPGTNASSLANTLGYSRTSRCVSTGTIYKPIHSTGTATLGQNTGDSTPTGQPESQGASDGGESSGAGSQDQQSPGQVSQGGSEVVQKAEPQDKHIQPTATPPSNAGSKSGIEPNNPDTDSPSSPGAGAGENCPVQPTVTVTAQPTATATVTVTVTATPSPGPMSDSGAQSTGAGTKVSSGSVPSGASTGLFPSGTGYLGGGGVQNGTYVRQRV